MSRRDKGYFSEEHRPTAKQVRRQSRLREQRRANLREDAFDSGTIRWEAYTHQQMWDMVHSADLPGMSVRSGQWQDLVPQLRSTSRSVKDIVNRLTSSWRGPSAELAAQAASALTSWGETVGDSAERVASGLETYTTLLQETKRRLPEPVHYWAERRFNEGYDVKVAEGPQGVNLLDQLIDDHMPSKAEARNAKAEAVAVMQVYENESRSTRGTLPVFDTAPPTAQQPQPGPAAPPPLAASPAPPPGPEPAPRPPEQSPVPGVRPPEPVNTESTTVAAFGPTGAGASNGSATFGGPGGTSGLHGAMPGMSGGTTAGLPGSAGPGTPGGATGVLGQQAGRGTSAGLSGRGATAVPGAPGYGMMPPPAGGGTDEERHHPNRYAEKMDLLDDIPPGAPPVLGG
ncbi:PPE domain-containing protein [Lentzea californiensis]|uniref:PPE domain-containing protein n=1 Tax=Lentzea californiensis TaxID=438851 RepID=UPI0021666AC6|nr:PPE domain-containing protein [Lentzea californiensis]MCR3750474.1 PPE family protein [Lentzea californiensis]